MMIMNKTYFVKTMMAVLCCLTLSSCCIYGKYEEKHPKAADIQVPSYREIFQDENLLAIIDTALVKNIDYQIAHERVCQAEASLKSARLAYLPSAHLTPGITHSNQPHLNINYNQYSFAAVSWELDIFGRMTNNKRIARATHKMMLDYEQAARTELIAAVANTYYTLVMLDAQIITADSAEANWKKSVETMRDLKAAGMADEAAVTQFEAKYNAIIAAKKNLELQRIQTENSMYILLGTSTYGIKRSQLDETKVGMVSELDLNVALNRPDVRAAEHNLETAFYGVKLANSNFCPNITLSGGIGLLTEELLMTAVAELVQPIFENGKLVAAKRIAKSKQREAELGYTNALLKAGLEINNAIASQKSYSEQSVFYAKEVDALTRALDVTRTKMRLGRGTYLEVLTSQNDLLNAQLDEIDNKMNVLKSTVGLFHAIGGGQQ